MKNTLLEWLCCPNCLRDLNCKVESRCAQSDEILTGNLVCCGCGESYPVIAGVPVFAKSALSNDVTARAFSDQWDGHNRGLFEHKDVFGLKIEEYLAHFSYVFNLTKLSVLKGVTVEAGIGSGCLAVALAKEAPENVMIGLDISGSVFSLAPTASEYPNLHLIQCDLVNPPLKRANVDRAYSSGVLHHIESPEKGISSLWSLLRDEGALYFWVYPHGYVCAYNNLRKLLVKPYILPGKVRYLLSWMLAPFMWTYFSVSKNYSYKQSLESLRTVAFRIFDNISPEYQHLVSRQDVANWCSSAGIKSYKIVDELGVQCTRN